jgi:two-component system, LytTR family, response regulator
MKVRTVIADDETAARLGLGDLLASTDWIELVGECADGHAAVEMIETLRPDLVFLDIQMPGLLGTEVLAELSQRPHVVFTTAFSEHAASAFELGALDYLLKPFGSERLGIALDRIRAVLGEPQSSPAVADRLREVLRSGPMSRLFVRVGGTIVPLAVDEVRHFEAWGDYVTAHLANSRHVLHLSLNRLESRLEPERFLRIHRAHIVNLDCVRAFRNEGRGRMVAELDDGSRLPVSRSRASALRELGV